jgi:hypothetical protein
MCKGADIDFIFDHSILKHGCKNFTVISNLRIPNMRIGANGTGFTNAGITLNVGVRPDDRIFAKCDPNFDIGGFRIHNRDAI